MTTIHYHSFPATKPPPNFSTLIYDVFLTFEEQIGTIELEKGLKSDEVLAILRPSLEQLGFEVETGKTREDKIHRPVLFGEDGEPTLKFEVDAYHPAWRCGMEVEAGRAWMGNAIYRDLIQSLVMVEVACLVLAVPNAYKYKSNGRPQISNDYANTVRLASTLYSHTRMTLPYDLIVIGY